MKKVHFIVLLALVFTSFSVSDRLKSKIDKEIKAVFEIQNYTNENIAIPEEINSELPLKINENNFFKINSEEKHLGYYYVGKAFGKADYFDFIVIFDHNLVVSKVKILVYREDHGGEIGSKRWLKQFIGKLKGQHLKYQKDIAAISGATISAKSMTAEVNKLLQTIEILHKKGLLS